MWKSDLGITSTSTGLGPAPVTPGPSKKKTGPPPINPLPKNTPGPSQKHAVLPPNPPNPSNPGPGMATIQPTHPDKLGKLSDYDGTRGVKVREFLNCFFA